MAEESEIVRAVVGRHRAVFLKSPERVPSNKHLDGPLLGNGDVGVVLAGSPERLSFLISKNDFWKSKPGYPDGGPRPIGGLDLLIPALANASYQVEVSLLEGELFGTFSNEAATIELRAWVAATENLLSVEVTVVSGSADIGTRLWSHEGDGSISQVSPEGDWISRRYDGPELAWPCEAVVATKILQAGEGLHLVAAIRSSFDSTDPVDECRQRLAVIDSEKVGELRAGHRRWWEQFWSESFVDIPDALIEQYYYGAQYLLACCSRNRDFPPGLWGNWVTTDAPAWAGDYHLNYNHQAPFWGLYSSNHLALADCYDAPLLDYIDSGRRNAEAFLNIRGIYYEVGIGPRGFCSSLFQANDSDAGTRRAAQLEQGHQFWGQKSNAIFGAVPMILRWQHSLDRNYAERIYPYLIEVANFWEDYLKFESGRYVIYRDCYSEAGPWEGEGWEEMREDFNPAISLGLLRLFFPAMIEVSRSLDCDGDRIEKWQHILNHLSELPLAEKNGERLPQGAERGPSQRKVGASRLTFHATVWPTSIVSETQLPEYFEIIRNSAAKWGEEVWVQDGNAFDTVPPGAARLRLDPNRILEMMRAKIKAHGLPNLLIEQSGGGIETCGGITAGINEMLLQSYEGILRLFPCWPMDRDAQFGNLRAWGAFLVSAQLRKGKVQNVKICSEKGSTCRLVNPWPNQDVRLIRNGRSAESLSGSQLEFSTEPEEEILFSIPNPISQKL